MATGKHFPFAQEGHKSVDRLHEASGARTGVHADAPTCHVTLLFKASAGRRAGSATAGALHSRSLQRIPHSASHPASTVQRVEGPINSTTADRRRVLFAGVKNLRDLGGYTTESGRTTRWRQMFRSDSPHNFTPGDLEVFDAMDIGVIYDLRRTSERDEDPGPRPCVHVELPSRPVFATDPVTLRIRDDGERWLFQDYCGMLDAAGPVFGRLFTEFSASDGPVMFHCMGGKDRTGMTAALLLSCLGVGRQTVLDDYGLTSRYSGPEHLPHVVDLFVAGGIAREAAIAMLGTPRWAMEGALDRLDSTYGGIESYLLGPAGMDQATLESLRDRFLG
jgi:protein-tyrosine phosphatase